MPKNYRTATLLLLFSGCIILMLNFGFRASMGFFLKPVSNAHGYGVEIFAFSLALQNLMWGIGQPFFGAIADKLGNVKALILGALLYAAGLALTAVASNQWELHLGAGLLFGLGIAGSGFGIVLPAMARAVPESKRTLALGLGTAAGSAGQFLLVPVAREFIVAYGWQMALLLMAGGALLMLLFAPALSASDAQQPAEQDEPESEQTLPEALTEARSHIPYWLLTIGFFVCGFQLAFITVHMPAYLGDLGFDSSVAAWSLSLIGLFNIFGSLTSGWLSTHYSKKWVLAIIYALRAVLIVLFLVLPPSLWTVYAFSIATGFLWLATVPPTSGLVAQMFGARYMATLYGIVFLGHQVGSFLGVWIGGRLYDQTGSYDAIWWAAAIIAAITAYIHVIIDERPVVRIRGSAVNPA